MPRPRSHLKQIWVIIFPQGGLGQRIRCFIGLLLDLLGESRLQWHQWFMILHTCRLEHVYKYWETHMIDICIHIYAYMIVDPETLKHTVLESSLCFWWCCDRCTFTNPLFITKSTSGSLAGSSLYCRTWKIWRDLGFRVMIFSKNCIYRSTGPCWLSSAGSSSISMTSSFFTFQAQKLK